MNISKENIDDLNAVLKLTVEKDDYESRVDEVLKDYRKKANMPGFRPGKVPFGMIKKMYGKHVLAEQVNKIVSDEISKYLFESKLNILGEPLPSETQETIDFETQENFQFNFDVAIAPAFEIKLSKREKLPYYTIEVTDEMLDQQVKQATSRFGTSESAEEATEESMIKGDLVQLDQEAKVLEGGITAEDTVISAVSIKDEETKAKLIGAKAGEVIIISPKKAFEDASQISYMLKVSAEEAEQIDGDFQFTVKEITNYVEAELNQELFDQVLGKDVATNEEEFVAKIKEDLEKTLAFESEYKFSVDAKEKLMKKVKIDLPEAFLKRWILTINHDKEEITPESLEKDMPKYLDDLRWQLIKNEILKVNEIKIEEADVLEVAKKSAKMQFMQYGLSNIPEEHLENYAKDIMNQEEQRRNMSETAAQDKVLAFIKESVKIEEKTVNREEFNKLFENN
ncbi:trigger factor [Saccharicrinis fermentans]|uniref:Trigger factor n=1 Tax=Saccharicrinis fermentans DSM 9555 = JCM 21142 TaxID=869213 RepID=W7YEN1_9BACT|nr:trigger factor [Saccharicrinis fermentans]GAF02911.1 trigger factor [Saccharicrinis fermentans DSM 9555 = JCM 21142]